MKIENQQKVFFGLIDIGENSLKLGKTGIYKQ